MTKFTNKIKQAVEAVKDFYNTNTAKKVTVTIFVVVALFASVFALVRPKDTVKEDVKITENKKEDVKVTEDKDKKDEKDDKKSDKKSDDKKTDKKTESKADSKPADKPASNKPAPSKPAPAPSKPAPAPSKPAPSKPVEPAKPAHTHTWTPVYKDHPAQAEQGHYETVPAVTREDIVVVVLLNGQVVQQYPASQKKEAAQHAMKIGGSTAAEYRTVVVAPESQKWVVDVPAKPAWREKTHEKCSCGATR